MPPQWISIVSPNRLRLIAEHSICQPGLPSPKGDGHLTSPSSGVHFFQRAKSLTDSFSYSSAESRPLAAAFREDGSRWESFPYWGKLAILK